MVSSPAKVEPEDVEAQKPSQDPQPPPTLPSTTPPSWMKRDHPELDYGEVEINLCHRCCPLAKAVIAIAIFEVIYHTSALVIAIVIAALVKGESWFFGFVVGFNLFASLVGVGFSIILGIGGWKKSVSFLKIGRAGVNFLLTWGVIGQYLYIKEFRSHHKDKFKCWWELTVVEVGFLVIFSTFVTQFILALMVGAYYYQLLREEKEAEDERERPVFNSTNPNLIGADGYPRPLLRHESETGTATTTD